MRDNADRMYFEWMTGMLTENTGTFRNDYSKLLEYLDMSEFYCEMERDENRVDDGYALRKRFCIETGCYIPFSEYRTEYVSVLEVIAALLLRIEEAVLYDPEEGHMPRIFLDIIENLGLMELDDRHWNEYHADDVIEKFLTRRYSRNGKGGMFITSGDEDMRTIEIWYQMMIYLRENY